MKSIFGVFGKRWQASLERPDTCPQRCWRRSLTGNLWISGLAVCCWVNLQWLTRLINQFGKYPKNSNPVLFSPPPNYRCDSVHFIGWIPAVLGWGPASIVRTDQSWSLRCKNLTENATHVRQFWNDANLFFFFFVSCCRHSIRHRNGTRWHQKPKISSIRCWLSILPSASRPPKPLNTHGSA